MYGHVRVMPMGAPTLRRTRYSGTYYPRSRGNDPAPGTKTVRRSMKVELLYCSVKVSEQVSRLVVMHEEAEDGAAMPDLTAPVHLVSKAVANLITVGYQTIHQSKDQILKQDMPPALKRVETSSLLLEDACRDLRDDPFSSRGRSKLIDGSRGILQGTSALLLCFDESEVRKIIAVCKKCLEYLAVSEVIESNEDLLTFVKDISPWLTRMSRDVDDRQKELTHKAHAEILLSCLDAVKTLGPILISAMKIFIQIGGGKGSEEAAENRNYMTQRMIDEINEIIRILQLTTYDEEWDADNVTVMKRALGAIEQLLQAALDWLADSRALKGGIGEKSIRKILDLSERVAQRSMPEDAAAIRTSCSNIASMTDSLAELRDNKQGDGPHAQGLARNIAQKLKELVGTKEIPGMLPRAILNVERSGLVQPAHTILGRIEQAVSWLTDPAVDDGGLGCEAIRLVLQDGRKLANLCPEPDKSILLGLCADIDRLSDQLSELCRKGMGGSPQAKSLASVLRGKLMELKDLMQKLLLDRVVEDFADISTPLRLFVEAVVAPENAPRKEEKFRERSHGLKEHSLRAADTGKLVSSVGTCKNKKVVEALNAIAEKVESMTPQIINAGKIRFHHSHDGEADRHFQTLRNEFASALERLRSLVDEAIDSSQFIKASEDAMRRHTDLCEGAIHEGDSQKMVDHTSCIARFANRVSTVGQNEADNSEDPSFVGKLEAAIRDLNNVISPMVERAKNVAVSPRNNAAASSWREANDDVLKSVRAVRMALQPEEHHHQDSGYGQEIPGSSGESEGPPRPPLPAQDNHVETFSLHESNSSESLEIEKIERDDNKYEAHWRRVPVPQDDEPILGAAHSLHQAIRQWSSRENEIVAAAKRMAILMAKLSQLVRGQGGNKKDLIDCAKAIAEASEEVTRLAVQLARQCTDKRMRSALLQVCERIPTIGTQLKILSTVKATMLGSQGTEEDQEAMELLVLNAQNLMQSVKDTVRAAEAASIKIRTDSGLRLRWIRKPVSYSN